MSPGVRRDLLIGGSLLAVGIALVVFALFGADEAFRAPRWVAALCALGFILGGIIPARSAFTAEPLRPRTPMALLAVGIGLLALALLFAWLLLAIGPEGITLDIALPLSDDIEDGVKTFVFDAVFGLLALACLAGAVAALARSLPSFGRTAVIAVVAPVLGLAAWVAIEEQGRKGESEGPVVWLSFDQRFPAGDYLSRAYGKELLAQPARVGKGLFVGGSPDWLDVEAPRGHDTRHGLTLEFWMKRENWVNPYADGARMQTVASVEVEREWKGRPEIQQIAFSLVAPGAEATLRTRRERRPESLVFRPQARVAEVKLTPLRSVLVTPGRWTHVAVVYDTFLVDHMRLYIDGRLAARAVPWGEAIGFADIRSLRIGTSSERNGAYRGMVDEVKVFSRALSSEEIEREARRPQARG